MDGFDIFRDFVVAFGGFFVILQPPKFFEYSAKIQFQFTRICSLGLYKKAIIDVDFVLQKLDEKNILSWIYRAKSYYLLGELRDFEKSINEAKKNNPKKVDFIEKCVANMQNGEQTDSNGTDAH